MSSKAWCVVALVAIVGMLAAGMAAAEEEPAPPTDNKSVFSPQDEADLIPEEIELGALEQIEKGNAILDDFPAGPDCDSCPLDGCGQCESRGGGCGTCGGCVAGFAGACVCRPGLVAYVDWLNWKARHDVHYATSRTGTSPNITERPQFASAFRDSGVRVGLGYHFSSCWDITWNYTYFHTNGSASAAAFGADNTMYLVNVSLAPDTGVDTAAMSIGLDYDVNDIEFGHWFCLDDTTTARIFGGFRWAIVDSHVNIRYTHTRLVTPNDEIIGTEGRAVGLEAYGLRLGAEGRWHLSPCLSLFGRGAGSVLAGRMKNREWEANSDGDTYSYRHTTTRALTVVDLSAGIAWTRKRFELSAGYELTAWENVTNDLNRDFVFDGFFVRTAWNR